MSEILDGQVVGSYSGIPENATRIAIEDLEMAILSLDRVTQNVTTVVAATTTQVLGVVVGDGSAVLTTGYKGAVQVPWNCTLTGWTILSIDPSTTSGSITFDLWSDAYANHPPTVADTIIGSGGIKPFITSGTKNTSTAVANWKTDLTAGVLVGFNIDSVSSLKKVILELTVTVTT